MDLAGEEGVAVSRQMGPVISQFSFNFGIITSHTIGTADQARIGTGDWSVRQSPLWGQGSPCSWARPSRCLPSASEAAGLAGDSPDVAGATRICEKPGSLS